MINTFCLFLTCIFFAFNAFAQKSDKKETDKAVLRCYYRFNKKVAQTDTTYRTDTLVLDIGNNISRFYDPSRIKRDSLLSATFNNNWSQIKEMNVQTENPPNYSNSPGSASSDLSQGESSQIIKDKGANKLKVLDVMLGIFDKYQYEEDLPAVSWLLHESSTMEILSYPCQKATAKFRGRVYTAWFAPEIPIINGPWKFTDLPGLILKVEDSEKLFSYELIGLEKPKAPIAITFNDTGFIKCTREQNLKLKKKQEASIQVNFNAGTLNFSKFPRKQELLLQETE